MKIFISFSTADHKLMHLLSTQLVEVGVTPVIAMQRRTPGAKLDEKVRTLINESDCVLVLHTPNALRSHWVQQEIGCAKAFGKYIVPLKSRGGRVSAMLEGIEYYEFSSGKPTPDFRRVAAFLRDYAREHKLPLGPTALRRADIAGAAERYLLHLPHAMQCPGCRNIDVHVFVCPLCAEWVCPQCGATIPPKSRAPGSAAGGA